MYLIIPMHTSKKIKWEKLGLIKRSSWALRYQIPTLSVFELIDFTHENVQVLNFTAQCRTCLPTTCVVSDNVFEVYWFEIVQKSLDGRSFTKMHMMHNQILLSVI